MKKLIPIILLLFCLTACSSKNDEKSLDFFAMDTYMNISVTAEKPQEILDKSFEKVTEIENLISRTNSKSDVYKLNHSGGEIVEVDSLTYEILSVALDCAISTDGAFDPTICAVTDLWGIGTENAKVPNQSEIDKALETVSYENIVLLGNNQVQLLNGANVDLGGVGKGFAADKIVEIFQNNNAISGVVSLAGNIYVYGEKENRTDWNIGVKDPNDTNSIALGIQTSQNSIVTTGAYERYFEENGKIYHHIFNSKTGYPTEEDILSVTVISGNSTLADIYATALFTMGYEKAIDFANSIDEIDVVIIRDDDTVYYSDGLSVTLGDKYEN